MIKRLTLSFMLFAGFGLLSPAQQSVSYQDNWGSAGFTVEQSGPGEMQLVFSVPRFTIGTMDLDGAILQTVELPGVFLPNNEGAPNLPGTGRYIAIPQGAAVSVEILDARTETFQGLDLAPAPRIPKETEDGLFYQKDMDIYARDAFYPASPVSVSKPASIRGVDAVMFGFTPFQYNPVTKTLLVYKDIRVKLHFTGGTGEYGDTRLRSRWFDPLLQDLLLNPEVLPEVDYNKSALDTDDTGFEYLIIVPNDPYFTAWADTIRLFRTRQGILTGVKTLAEVGGNTTTAIESYINNAYNTWSIPPVAILLIGDYGTNANHTLVSPIWDSYCVSDNIYGDVNNDDMPDIVMARMTAQNEQQLEVMVRKFIDYERNPPTDPDFYDHPITALGWQTERWFQVCSEVIGGFWEHALGKEPVRINEVYDGNPASDPWSTATNTNTVVNYFGPGGLGYIPATPQALGNWTGGTPAMVNNAINEGSFMLQHRDHGFEGGWGEPAYGSSDISGLHNTDLCYIMSVNCLTGKYNHTSEVFAEKFHRYTWNNIPSGAVGILAASEVSYSFVNDAFIWGVYDNMWPEFMPLYGSTPAERGILPAFGNAAGKYFLQQSSWPYNTSNKEVTYNLFHHHGDAFLSVYSEVPQTLTVVHNPIIYTGVTGFDVTADGGSLICLSLNGEILGTATGTGSPVNITIPGTQLPPDEIDVVVTLQNYYRYEAKVPVIPPVGPYVIKHSVQIQDPAGNNNGQADYDEDILVDLAVKNVGVTQATGVTVTLQTASPYVNFTDDSETYGDIGPDTVLLLQGAFAFHVAGDVPDGHVADFDVIATNGTDTWTSHFAVVLNAPLLQVGSVTIDDQAGNNNHRLDPGETVLLSIVTKNAGHSLVDDLNALLSSADTSVLIMQPAVSLNPLSPGDTDVAQYVVQVSAFAVPGSNVPFFFEATDGIYQGVKTFVQPIGLMIEDWESNTFTQFPWINNTGVPWTLTAVNPYQGQYCARSGVIGNNGSTELSISLDVAADDSIVFFRKVSSEASYDFLEFYIDNNMVGQWSGEMGWSREAYPVPSGAHTFLWKYTKDVYLTGGSDAAWIDDIVFPPFGSVPLQLTASASPATLCSGGTTQLSIQLTGGIAPYAYQWSPAAGLNDPTLANPVAAPVIGTVYTVTVTDANMAAATATVVVTVNEIPAIPAAPTANQTTVCQGTTSTLVSTGSVPGAISYSWSVTPSNAASVNGTGANAWVNWYNTFHGQAEVSVRANNSCGQSAVSQALTFTVVERPAVSLTPLANACVYWPEFALSGGMPAGGTYTGPGVVSGMFNPALAMTGTWNIQYTYLEQGTGCSNSASQPITVDACAGIDDRDAAAGISLYPNPSRGLLTLHLDESPATGFRVRVTSALGKLVLEHEFQPSLNGEYVIDLAGQAEGLYFLSIEREGGTSTQKVVLQEN